LIAFRLQTQPENATGLLAASILLILMPFKKRVKVVQDDLLLLTAAQALFQSFQSRVAAFAIALAAV
jgi:hypothetical protein